MKTKVIVSYPNDKEQSEIIQADPFDSLKFICKLKKVTFETGRLINVCNSYEYPIKNGVIIQAKQIA